MRILFCAMLTVALAIGSVGIATKASAVPKAPGTPKKTQVEIQFNKLDKDMDGKVTLDEFTATKKGKAKDAAEKLFKKWDTDNSGDLTLEEFKLKGRKPKTPKTAPNAIDNK